MENEVNQVYVDKDNLVATAQKLFDQRYRFVTATCLDRIIKYDVLYHFVPADAMGPVTQLRVIIARNETLPSISGVYAAAMLAENEMLDDFEIKIDGLTPDLGGRLLRTKDSPDDSLMKTPPNFYVPGEGSF